MADVFLSYSHSDAERARTVTEALMAHGLTVWWDPELPTAKRWEQELQPELEQARCVVVLWSRSSVRSQWVRREAEAAVERSVLVPALIDAARIPPAARAIQAANLSAWNGDAAASEFREFLDAVQATMLPTCEIRFRSLLYPEAECVESMLTTLVQVSRRMIDDEGGSRYHVPEDALDKRRLDRTIASVGVTIEWHPALTALFDLARESFDLDVRLAQISKRVPRLWLDLLTYAGPYQFHRPRTHSNYLTFASLFLYHRLFSIVERTGRRIDVEPPLTRELLSNPRWQGTMPVLFDPAEELACAYVTRLDDEPLTPEVITYGPRGISGSAYEKSTPESPYTDPVWLEEYFIPQFELLLAMERPDRRVTYEGNAYIRKVTDLEGNDID